MTAQLAAERLMVDVDSDESKESVNREEDYCVYDTVVSDVDSKYSESEETDVNTFNIENNDSQGFLGADGTRWEEVFVEERDVGQRETLFVIVVALRPTS